MRRRRAVAFLVAALGAALAAAAIADRYGSSVARSYGALRPAVVIARDLPAGRPLDPGAIGAALTVRRVPERFLPSGALASPSEALGLAPIAALPSGSYLLAGQLTLPRRRPGPTRGLRGGRGPVEIAVSGADALAAIGGGRGAARVDVVVTTEPNVGGRGRSYVAAEDVPLLALRPGLEEPGPGGAAAATLGLTRRQALRLLAAQSYARGITLLAGGSR